MNRHTAEKMPKKGGGLFMYSMLSLCTPLKIKFCFGLWPAANLHIGTSLSKVGKLLVYSLCNLAHPALKPWAGALGVAAEHAVDGEIAVCITCIN